MNPLAQHAMLSDSISTFVLILLQTICFKISKGDDLKKYAVSYLMSLCISGNVVPEGADLFFL